MNVTIWAQKDCLVCERVKAFFRIVRGYDHITIRDAGDNEIKNAQRLFYDGYEFRSILCQIERNYNTKTYMLTRTDTGEVVEERPLRQSELQRKLLRDDQAREREEAAVNV